MTYHELAQILDKASPEQMQQDVTVYDKATQTFMPVSTAYVSEKYVHGLVLETTSRPTD